MRYAILGPLEVRDDGRTVALAVGRQRLLLAVLLAHAGEVLSRDRLVDALWDEQPPRTAPGSLHNLVSGLRRVLGDGVLETRGSSYVLHVRSEQIDAQRFTHLSDRGRQAAAGGDHARAAELLGEALRLWRGPAFGDLAYATALRGEAERLDELRLEVCEQRIDADLALGRHATLLSELQALCDAHPFRERFRAQQMLALYRSGRQADALAAYDRARHRLVDELGLEPGPELARLQSAVLAQDPALGVPDGPAVVPRVPRHAPRVVRRHPLLAGAAGATLLIAAVLAAALSGGGPRAASSAAVADGDSLSSIDPVSGRVSGQVRVGLSPTTMAVGAGAVWVINGDGQTISRVDLASSATRTFSTGAIPLGVQIVGGALWVLQGRRVEDDGPGASPLSRPVGVARFDPDSLTRERTIALPPAQPGTGVVGQLMAAGPGGLWVLGQGGSVNRVDLRTGRLASVPGVQATAVTAGGGAVWIRDQRAGLRRIDPRTLRPLARVAISADDVGWIAATAGALWITDGAGGSVWRLDARTGSAEPVGAEPEVDRVAAGAGAVWATNSVTRTLIRIDPRTHRVTARARIAGTPLGVVAGAGRVWVGATAPHGRPAGGLGAHSGIEALPASSCGHVTTAPGGAPRLLIAVDLPLSGQAGATEPMAAAVAFELARHHFRAGRYRIGLQACDDSLGQTGTSALVKCLINGRAYAADPAVIGIVGPLNSSCAEAMLPSLNTAPGGPVSAVSPSNSNPLLVRSDPNEPGALRHVYPSGQRGYARVYPSDDYEAAAVAILAHRLGHGSVALLQDGFNDDTTSFGPWFAHAAGRLHLRIAARATWDPQADHFTRIARQVAASGAGAVVVNGFPVSHLRPLLRDLRAAIGPHVPVIGTQATLSVSALFANAGGYARGLYLSSPGLAIAALDADGRRFVDAFARTQPDHHVTNFDVYAAAATDVLLDAIARSDGTRESVARALATTTLPRSPLGPIRFNRHGELASSPITIMRAVAPAGHADDILGVDGARLVGVIRPPSTLLANRGS
jgi:DNA-binding SARP family transcriptional activator/ABC-type branched-subunit amino acid transport system substrate-binding protein/DNA-binding beta-propeller fold protein YncE